MYNSYVYSNGKVIVADETGMYNPEPYRDNIESVLKSRNAIEDMTERLDKYSKKQNKLDANFKYLDWKTKRNIAVAAFIGVTVVGLSSGYANLGADTFASVNNMVTGLIQDSAIVAVGLSFAEMVRSAFIRMTKLKKMRNEATGNRAIVENLENALANEKDNLKHLEADQVKALENTQINGEPISITEKNREERRRLTYSLKLLKEAAINESKYSKLLKDGSLHSFLNEKYDESGANLIEGYIQYKQLEKVENGRTYVKTK